MTTQELARSAAATLTAIVERYRQHQAAAQGQPALRPANLDPSGIPPRWLSGLAEATERPIRFALRAAAREVGWQLYAAGGLDLMQEAMNLVDDATPSRPAGAVLDKWWDGIGLSERGVWTA